jgi:hypothetical protein
MHVTDNFQSQHDSELDFGQMENYNGQCSRDIGAQRTLASIEALWQLGKDNFHVLNNSKSVPLSRLRTSAGSFLWNVARE